VVILPSAFTIGNLFFGFWAIVSAYTGNFIWAGWFIVIAGVLDLLDGRIARLSQTGSHFGAELDSLVDLTSFGVAPALMMYFLEFSQAGRFGWVICFIYVVAVALRLARYNVTPPGEGHRHWFTGLPSTAGGMALAVYYPFAQTSVGQATLGQVNSQLFLALLILGLSALMVSNVRYPKLPGIGFRSTRGILGLLLHLIILTGGLLIPEYFFFPFGMTYIAYGLLRATVYGMLERGEDQAIEYPGHGTAAHPSIRRIEDAPRRRGQGP
jgi:CDP-diacylglycerol--serine O-phosphatidyltransferase